MIRSASVQTQILIFELFGEYILPGQRAAWTPSLLTLLDALGVSERAARSTLSRMRQKGWLTSVREGRHSRYSLTRRGEHIVRGAGLRIFEPRQREWNGLWHLVVYSLPEAERPLRARIRQRLGWLGFGQLVPGVWISPNDRREQVRADLEDLEAEAYVTYFADTEVHYASSQEIVQRCWDLEAINVDYEEFLRSYGPLYEDYRLALKRGTGMTPSEIFRDRFFVALDYSGFPRRDPNLPAELLRADWLGTEATEMFLEFYDLLREPAEGFADEVLDRHPLKSRLIDSGEPAKG